MAKRSGDAARTAPSGKAKAAKNAGPEAGQPAAAPKPPTVAELRAGIDALDRQLLGLLNDRARLAQAIGRLKDASGGTVFAPGREAEVLARLAEANPGPLPEAAIRAVFREIMSGSRALQRALRVAYLGPEYSFSHLAAMEKFGAAVEFAPVANIAGVFDMVNRGQAEFGLVPIENSTDGRVADTLDMFVRLPLRICAEAWLRVRHNLLSLSPMAEIHRVYSKWQALSQCRHWLATNLPRATLHEVQSTATAAQLALSESGAAAVASGQAATAYGLPILCRDIEDRRNNRTRFAVIGRQVADRTGDDKTAIMFQTPDAAGALCDILAVIKRNEVNMTWIESFPQADAEPGGMTSYLFFADLSGHEADPPVANTLEALRKRCPRLVVLGTFPRAAPLEG